MKKLLFFVLMSLNLVTQNLAGKSPQLARQNKSKNMYELYRIVDYKTQLWTGELPVILSSTTGTVNEKGQQTWGPTKPLVRSEGAWKKLGKKPNGPIQKIRNGNYIVLINSISEAPEFNDESKFVKIGLDKLYSAVQSQKPYVFVSRTNKQGKKTFKKINLDPQFFAALVKDYDNGQNPEGFVSSSIELLNPTMEHPGRVDEVSMDSSGTAF
jgi:hypothetical protein